MQVEDLLSKIIQAGAEIWKASTFFQNIYSSKSISKQFSLRQGKKPLLLSGGVGFFFFLDMVALEVFEYTSKRELKVLKKVTQQLP